MRTITLFFFSILFGNTCDGQIYWWLNFEEGLIGPHDLSVEFLPEALENSWQVGIPEKNNFVTAHSPENVIVTDIDDPYAPNDSSFFILPYTLDEFGSVLYLQAPLRLRFWYQSDCDSLLDSGNISFSIDAGVTWTDVMSAYYDVNDPMVQSWNSGILPTLTGNSGGWQEAYIPIFLWQVETPQPGDIVLIRFGFTSDDIDTARDGLMYDDILIDDMWEGINNKKSDTFSLQLVNNTVGNLNLNISDTFNSTYQVNIIDLGGRIVYSKSNLRIGMNHLELTDLGTGLYILEVTDCERKNRAERLKLFNPSRSE